MRYSILDFVFRHSCVFCGATHESRCICRKCLRTLPRNLAFCERCGQSVIKDLPHDVPCAACQKRPPAYAKARSPFDYAFPIDAALKALKFRRQLMYVPAFASLLLPVLKSEFSDCDALVAVPLHRWRHITRGFNQAIEICKELATEADLAIVDNVVRVRATKSQSGLSAAMRKKNLRGAFEVRGKLYARYPLIVDDVITTGATCEQLAIALQRAGAGKVGVLTVARASSVSR